MPRPRSEPTSQDENCKEPAIREAPFLWYPHGLAKPQGTVLNLQRDRAAITRFDALL